MTEITANNEKIIVVVDAHCAACAGGARWIAKNDREKAFQIASLQSELGAKLLRDHDLDPDDPASWLLLHGDKALTGVEAWFYVGHKLGKLRWILGALKLVPKPIRDFFYRLVARNRRRLFGRDDLCRMPDPRVAERLIQ